jgi:hypothetical protein
MEPTSRQKSEARATNFLVVLAESGVVLPDSASAHPIVVGELCSLDAAFCGGDPTFGAQLDAFLDRFERRWERLCLGVTRHETAEVAS